MPPDEQNPYSAPASAIKEIESIDETSPRGVRWRIIPTTLFSIFGAGGLASGVYVVATMVWFVFEGNQEWQLMLAAGAVVLCPGIGCLLAARFFWMQRSWRGLIAVLAGFLAGIVFPLIVALMMGW